MKQLNILLSFLLIGLFTTAQPLVNEADVLRGSLNENRDWFDIKRYGQIQKKLYRQFV